MDNPYQPAGWSTNPPSPRRPVRTVLWLPKPIKPVRCRVEQIGLDGEVTQVDEATMEPDHLAAHALCAPHIKSVTVVYDDTVDARETRFIRISD